MFTNYTYTRVSWLRFRATYPSWSWSIKHIWYSLTSCSGQGIREKEGERAWRLANHHKGKVLPPVWVGGAAHSQKGNLINPCVSWQCLHCSRAKIGHCRCSSHPFQAAFSGINQIYYLLYSSIFQILFETFFWSHIQMGHQIDDYVTYCGLWGPDQEGSW